MDVLMKARKGKQNQKHQCDKLQGSRSFEASHQYILLRKPES
jgi:hypothetical protein